MRSFIIPQALAFDTFGDLLIADTSNNVIREVGTSGIINTIAGTGGPGYSGDGGAPLSAALNAPQGLAIDQTNEIFITDAGNNRVREVTEGHQHGCRHGQLRLQRR